MRTPYQKTLTLLAIPFLFLTFSAFMISPLKVESEAFGQNKKFAVVSIMATSKVRSDSQSGGLAGFIKGASKKHKFSQDASQVLQDSIPILMKEFGNSKSFKLAEKSIVMNNKAYQAMKPDKAKKWFGIKMITADGYKYFKSKDKIKRLAEEMNVDGIIIVSLSYSVGFTGANISGAVGVGKQKGVVIVSIYAVDQGGKVVWKHAKQGVSKKGTIGIGGAADFEKLHASLLDATRIATQKLIKKLDKKVGT